MSEKKVMKPEDEDEDKQPIIDVLTLDGKSVFGSPLASRLMEKFWKDYNNKTSDLDEEENSSSDDEKGEDEKDATKEKSLLIESLIQDDDTKEIFRLIHRKL